MSGGDDTVAQLLDDKEAKRMEQAALSSPLTLSRFQKER
jgi:hypothetical protein